MKGFMVLPEHRNGPIGYLVLKEAVRRLGIAAVLTVADPSRRLFEAMGFRNLGMLSNQILPLRPARIAASIDAEALGKSRRLPAHARCRCGSPSATAAQPSLLPGSER